MLQISAPRPFKKAIRFLCEIRARVARLYIAKGTPPITNPTVRQLRDYELPGSAVGECHSQFQFHLRQLLQKHHKDNKNKKKEPD